MLGRHRKAAEALVADIDRAIIAMNAQYRRQFYGKERSAEFRYTFQPYGPSYRVEFAGQWRTPNAEVEGVVHNAYPPMLSSANALLGKRGYLLTNILTPETIRFKVFVTT